MSLTRRDVLRVGAFGILTSNSVDSLIAQEAQRQVLRPKLPAPSADDIAKANRLVDTIELADIKELASISRTRVAARDAAKQAFVNNGSVQSFVAGMNPTLRQDVLDSTLLAQLAATKQHDRFSDAENWYKKYKEVLENIGWVIQNFDFTKYSSSGGSFTVASDVIKVLLAICTGDEQALVTAAVEAMKKLAEGSEGFVIFEKSSHSSSQGNFQICAAAEDNKMAVMKIGGFKFDSSDSVTRVLFFGFSSASASFFKGTQNLVLNDGVYSRIRAAVKTKLGDKAEQYVKELPI